MHMLFIISGGLVISLGPSSAFVSFHRRQQHKCFSSEKSLSFQSLKYHTRHCPSYLFMGYRFGDVSKSILGKVQGGINDNTGKDKYEFGDLSRWLDKKSKEYAASITGKEDYEFGDLSRWIDTKVKDEVNTFSGKPEYEFGDLTKEILKRVLTGEYDLMEIVSLCKILLKFGVGLRPVAGFFPAKILVELLNISIVQNLGLKIIASFAEELDRRMKRTISEDKKHILGDLTKREIRRFTNKDDYTFGDITKTVVEDVVDGKAGNDTNSPKTFLSDASLKLSPDILMELKDWDTTLFIKSMDESDKRGKVKT